MLLLLGNDGDKDADKDDDKGDDKDNDKEAEKDDEKDTDIDDDNDDDDAKMLLMIITSRDNSVGARFVAYLNCVSWRVH